MSTPPLANSELVSVAWIASIAGLTADGVATQLPSDEAKWAAHGFIVVPTNVGGTPHTYAPMRRPVCQVECWATVPGSDKLPWNIAADLAEQVRDGTYDRTTFGRALAISARGVQYQTATVKAATVLTEPRRIWSDTGDYAGYTLDLLLHWVQTGEVIA